MPNVKKPIRAIFASAVMILAGPGVQAANSDLEIHIQPQQTDNSGTQVTSGGSSFHSKEHWIYEVTIENKTFRDLNGLELRYVLFFKQEKFGSKEAAAPQRQNGNIDIGLLKAHEKKSVKTTAVELNKATLSGDYYFPSGGRERAQDSLGGLWVRVFQNGQQVAEYANPSTLTREKWE
jgi:hypothetical protein